MTIINGTGRSIEEGAYTFEHINEKAFVYYLLSQQEVTTKSSFNLLL
jgi:hypothetical protein